MTTTSHITRQESNFGLMQWLVLATILLVGALVIAQCLNLTQSSGTGAKGPDAFLWVLELLVYVGIIAVLSRKVFSTVIGLVVGMVLRSILGIMGALIAHHPFDSLLRVDGSYSMVHFLIIVTIATVMLIPLRSLIASGFAQVLSNNAASAGNSTQQFYFTARQASKSNVPIRSKLGRLEETTEKAYLCPPEGFTPVFPVEQDLGGGYVRGKVVLESVPESKEFLEPEAVVHIPLSYIVPQLQRATAWLTWEQIFGRSGAESTNPIPLDREAEFRHRWVRLSAKYYVTQVPPELFNTKKNAPGWMRQPEVPQEHRFKLE